MVENGRAKILWDFQIRTDKLVMANRPDIVVVDKQRKEVIDNSVPSDSNIRGENKRREVSKG